MVAYHSATITHHSSYLCTHSFTPSANHLRVLRSASPYRRLSVRRDMVHSESRLRDPGSCATQVAQILSERRFMPEDAVFTAA